MSFWNKIFGINKQVDSTEVKKPNIKGAYFEIKSNVNGVNLSVDQKSVVLFVHGFGGEAVATWGETPKFLMDDVELKNWDIALLGYNSGLFPNFLKGLWTAPPNISIIGKNVATNIETLQKMGYTGISICAHSMGGLAVQKAMVDMAPDQAASIRNIILFGTPSLGLKKSRLIKFLNDQVEDMSSGGDFIKALRNDWKGKYENSAPFNFISIAGDKDQFVPPESSLSPFKEEQTRVIGGDHLSMVKASSDNDQAVLFIKNTLRNIETFDSGWDPILVEVQLGEFEKALAKYPNLDNEKFKELDGRFQVAYLMALDGTGKRDRALELGKYIGKDNTDVMGKLAGIFKRMYLADGIKEYYDRAYSLYFDAHQATRNTNYDQLYYHSVNLAFLETNKGNEYEAKNWARIAIDAAEKAYDNVWKWATVAEANIYLNKPKESLSAYKKALEFKPKLWQKESMVINGREAFILKGLNNCVEELHKIFGIEQ